MILFTKKLRAFIFLALSAYLIAGITAKAIAQEVDKDFIKAHLSQNVYAIDSDASAVVLYENQKVTISPVGDGYMQYHHVYKVIKILKPDAFSCGNVVVGYWAQNKSNFVHDITGTTYNLEHNRVVKTALSQSEIFEKKLESSHYYSEDHNKVNFQLPAIKEGSIIEYSYEEVTPVYLLLPAWSIQEEYPKLKSVYDISIPNNFQITSVLQTKKPFKKYSSEGAAERDNATAYYTSGDVLDTRQNTWVSENIAAVTEEPYSDTVNSTERIDFQIATVSAYGSSYDYVKSWEKLDERLLNSEDMGQRLNAPNNFLNNITDSLTKLCTTDLQKAKAIFNYVRSNFTANNSRIVYIRRNLSTIFENKGASEAEVNMVLIAMLRKADLNADFVVLSTKGELKAKEIFPILDRFNYLICALQIDSSRILLDASGKYNAFNSLPSYCYNGYARQVSKDGTGFLLTPDKAVEKWKTEVQVADFTDTAMDIVVTEKFGVNTSARLRKEWVKDSSKINTYLHEHTEHLAENVFISQKDILNLDDPDTSLIIKYTCHIKRSGHGNEYFLNTAVVNFFKENPFKVMERKLPVEFPYRMDYSCTINVPLPKEYKVEEVPKPVFIDYGSGEIAFKKMIDYNENLNWLTINTHFFTKQTVYPVENYGALKQFFDKMIHEEKNIISLKKI